jgi:hypothetical protein
MPEWWQFCLKMHIKNVTLVKICVYGILVFNYHCKPFVSLYRFVAFCKQSLK